VAEGSGPKETALSHPLHDRRPLTDGAARRVWLTFRGLLMTFVSNGDGVKKYQAALQSLPRSPRPLSADIVESPDECINVKS
jgi:hypothetical protein